MVVHRIASLVGGLMLFATGALALESSFEGHLRGGYILYTAQKTFQNDAGVIGGRIAANAAITEYLHVNTGLHFSELLYATDAANVTGDVTDADTKGYAMLGEAALEVDFEGHHLRLGRQLIDTPHADSDDIRIVPDLFQAYRYIFDAIPDTVFEAVYFTHMGGWENGVDPKRFVTLHEMMGITDASGNAITTGMAMAHAGYGNEHFSLEVYDYYLFGAYNMLYAETGVNFALFDGVSVDMALQYNGNMGWTTYLSGTTPVSNLSAHAVGGAVTLSLEELGSEMGVAATLGVGRDAIAGSWGGGPYFTSLESMTFDAIGDAKGRAYVGTITQDLFFEGVAAAYAFGYFRGETSASYSLYEHNVALTYEKEGVVTWYLGAAVGRDGVDAANNYEFIYTLLEFPLQG